VSGWQEICLGDLGRVVTGKTPSTSVPDYFGGEVPFVTPSDMYGHKVISRTARSLTKAGVAAVKGSFIPKGSVMVSCIGSDMGKVTIAAYDCVSNQQINSIVVSESFSPDFIYYNLSTRKAELQSMACSGSAQPILNKGHFSQLPISLPPLSEQRAIASVLGSLDDKIDLNRRMNETLEALAQSLFKSSFVPACRSLGVGRDTTQSALPKGWREGKVSDLATLSRDGLNPGEFSDEVFDHYSLPAFDEGRTPKTEKGDTIMSNKFLVPPDCVMVSKLNPRIPRIWLPDLRGPNRAVCSTEFLVATPKPGVSREFLYCLFINESFASVFTTMVTGTSGSHQRVRPESLLSMDTPLPPAPLIQKFTETVAPMLKRISQNIYESRTLAALRDALLPKLLSGELRVPAAAKLVEAAA